MIRIFLIFLTLSSLLIAQERYKLYCMHTPHFETLYRNYFLPSLKDDLEIVVKEYPQDCPSGMFFQEGWDLAMLHKLELLEEAIFDNWGSIFFYSDVDIIFLRSIVEASLKSLDCHDFVVQQGWPRNRICAGFFVMRGNERTLRLIQQSYQLLQNKRFKDDQQAIQCLLDQAQSGEISWGFLPSEQFPNGRRVMKKTSGYYLPGSDISLHESILLFHANCCVGLDNKFHFLRSVQEEFLRFSK